MSDPVTLKFQLLNDAARLPMKSWDSDAGFDLYAARDDEVCEGDHRVLLLGIVSEIPEGYYVQIQGRSGLASIGFDVLGGVVDSGYRGEWKVILINHGCGPRFINKGDRVAQGVLLPVPRVSIVEVDALADSDRGGRGFGSSGR